MKHTIQPTLSTRINQDVYGSQAKILVDRNERRYRGICRPVRRRVKVEHQWPAELLQPLHILVWKWDEISMDFIVGLPKTPSGHDSIWVIVDRLTKVAHFIPIRTEYTCNKLALLYIDNILRLHGVPSWIILDRGTQFITRFWKSLHKALGTRLDYSSAYHP